MPIYSSKYNKRTYPHNVDSDDDPSIDMEGTITPDSNNSTSDWEFGTFL